MVAAVRNRGSGRRLDAGHRSRQKKGNTDAQFHFADLRSAGGEAMNMAMATPPEWVTNLGWLVTGIGLLLAAVVLADAYLGGYRQSTPALEAVWAITAVYAGGLALWAYYRWGRQATPKWQQQHGRGARPGQAVTAGVHTIAGGAASVIGHAIAVPVVMVTGMTIAGQHVWPMILLIAVLALPLLVVFEYRSLGLAGQTQSAAERLRVALPAAALAIIAFDVGMAAVMLLQAFVLHYPPTTSAFWLLMWVGMWLGFATAYPIVWRLLAGNAPQLAAEREDQAAVVAA
jgi:hypothetical protein